MQGSIVNVSSIAAIIPMPHFTSYTVAKAAQDAMTRSLALEYAPKGLRAAAAHALLICRAVFVWCACCLRACHCSMQPADRPESHELSSHALQACA